MKTLCLAAFAALGCIPLLDQDGARPSGNPTDASAPKPVPASPAIGVVDLVKVFKQNPKWIKAGADLQRLKAQSMGQIEDKRKAINELRAAIEQMDEDSESRRDAQAELALLEAHRRALAERLQEKLALEEMRAYVAVYDDIEVGIRKVAQMRGVALVVRLTEVEPPPAELGKMSPRGVDERFRNYERRQVLYAAPELDLTADLIKLLMVPLDVPKDGKDAAKDGKAPAATPAPANGKTGG